MQTPQRALAAPAQDLPPPASQPAPASFFYPHGIWAPGVRLMRNLQFSAKALSITALFMLPLLWLAWSFFALKHDNIAFSQKELDGVEYNRTLLPVLARAEALRRAAVAAAQSAPGAASALDDAKRQLAEAQAPLAEVQQRLGEGLGTASAYAAVQAAHKNALGAQRVNDLFKAHNAHVRALMELLEQATDGSNLTLDPDIDTYYLMDGAYGRLPTMMEMTAQLRGVGAAALEGGNISVAQQNDFTDWMALAQFQMDQLAKGVQKVQGANPGLAGKISADEARKHTTELFTFARKVLVDEPAYDAAVSTKLLALSNAALAAQYQLAQQMTTELATLLQARVGRMQAERSLVAVGVLLSVLLASYLFYCFFLVTRGGLRLISHHLQDMAEGDLRKAPSQPWGKDEPAQVIIDLRRTYDALHQLIRRVRHSARELTTTAREIASASTDLSARTEAAAATLEEQAAAMEQIGATVAGTAERARDAAQFSGENAAVAERGGAVIGQVVHTMRDIQSSSSKIGDIIGVIDGIAFQTNILALNAAVEAARAGDAGRGFAVVASEVRGLAQRSAEAAREIKGLITASTEKVEGGTQVVEEAGQTMLSVVANAKQVNTHLSEIALASQQQASGVEQVAQAIQSLDRDTQQNSALVEETNAAAESLRQQADLLMQEIANFRVG